MVAGVSKLDGSQSKVKLIWPFEIYSLIFYRILV